MSHSENTFKTEKSAVCLETTAQVETLEVCSGVCACVRACVWI